jgi:DNA-directed RNA polymerase subunit H
MPKKKLKIDKHSLIPKHVKLSDKEKEALLKKYNITLSELPKILKDDPAIQSIGAKSGDVIKIIRKSPTAGEAVFYRGVTNV